MHFAFRRISKRRRCLAWIRRDTQHCALWTASSPRLGATDGGLLHVIAYSDANAERREIPGLLDDYAFTTLACLDAYEAAGDLSYFNFARRIADGMIERFFDAEGGGFLDAQTAQEQQNALGVLGTRRKPFQDSPTPAGNSMAAIALLRLYAYTNEAGYRERAQQTIGLLAGMAGQYGLFAATYGIAAVYFLQPHTQVVVVGSGEAADRLYACAVQQFNFGKAVLRFTADKIVPQNLPPALGEIIPHSPLIEKEKAGALLCSGFACQGPISEPEELSRRLQGA